MIRLIFSVRVAAVTILAVGLAGCVDQKTGSQPATSGKAEPAPGSTGKQDKIEAARAKLSPADRALVEAQEWCANSTSSRLGSMGTPIKLEVKGQPVFICCDHCRKAVLANPETTLKTVAKLKEKAKTLHEGKTATP